MQCHVATVYCLWAFFRRNWAENESKRGWGTEDKNILGERGGNKLANIY